MEIPHMMRKLKNLKKIDITGKSKNKIKKMIAWMIKMRKILHLMIQIQIMIMTIIIMIKKYAIKFFQIL
jgi:hypothetical protein